MAARRRGQYERARELHLAAVSFYREAARTGGTGPRAGVPGLRGARDQPDAGPVALALEGLACVAAARRQPHRAAVLLGAAQALRERGETPLPVAETVDVERAADAAARSLGAQAFTGLLAEGRRMSTQQAADYAAA